MHAQRSLFSPLIIVTSALIFFAFAMHPGRTVAQDAPDASCMTSEKNGCAGAYKGQNYLDANCQTPKAGVTPTRDGIVGKKCNENGITGKCIAVGVCKGEKEDKTGDKLEEPTAPGGSKTKAKEEEERLRKSAEDARKILEESKLKSVGTAPDPFLAPRSQPVLDKSILDLYGVPANPDALERLSKMGADVWDDPETTLKARTFSPTGGLTEETRSILREQSGRAAPGTFDPSSYERPALWTPAIYTAQDTFPETRSPAEADTFWSRATDRFYGYAAAFNERITQVADGLFVSEQIDAAIPRGIVFDTHAAGLARIEADIAFMRESLNPADPIRIATPEGGEYVIHPGGRVEEVTRGAGEDDAPVTERGKALAEAKARADLAWAQAETARERAEAAERRITEEMARTFPGGDLALAEARALPEGVRLNLAAMGDEPVRTVTLSEYRALLRDDLARVTESQRALTTYIAEVDALRTALGNLQVAELEAVERHARRLVAEPGYAATHELALARATDEASRARLYVEFLDSAYDTTAEEYRAAQERLARAEAIRSSIERGSMLTSDPARIEARRLEAEVAQLARSITPDMPENERLDILGRAQLAEHNARMFREEAARIDRDFEIMMRQYALADRFDRLRALTYERSLLPTPTLWERFTGTQDPQIALRIRELDAEIPRLRDEIALNMRPIARLVALNNLDQAITGIQTFTWDPQSISTLADRSRFASEQFALVSGGEQISFRELDARVSLLGERDASIVRLEEAERRREAALAIAEREGLRRRTALSAFDPEAMARPTSYFYAADDLQALQRAEAAVAFEQSKLARINDSLDRLARGEITPGMLDPSSNSAITNVIDAVHRGALRFQNWAWFNLDYCRAGGISGVCQGVGFLYNTGLWLGTQSVAGIAGTVANASSWLDERLGYSIAGVSYDDKLLNLQRTQTQQLLSLSGQIALSALDATFLGSVARGGITLARQSLAPFTLEGRALTALEVELRGVAAVTPDVLPRVATPLVSADAALARAGLTRIEPYIVRTDGRIVGYIDDTGGTIAAAAPRIVTPVADDVARVVVAEADDSARAIAPVVVRVDPRAGLFAVPTADGVVAARGVTAIEGRALAAVAGDLRAISALEDSLARATAAYSAAPLDLAAARAVRALETQLSATRGASQDILARAGLVRAPTGIISRVDSGVPIASITSRGGSPFVQQTLPNASAFASSRGVSVQPRSFQPAGVEPPFIRRFTFERPPVQPASAPASTPIFSPSFTGLRPGTTQGALSGARAPTVADNVVPIVAPKAIPAGAPPRPSLSATPASAPLSQAPKQTIFGESVASLAPKAEARGAQVVSLAGRRDPIAAAAAAERIADRAAVAAARLRSAQRSALVDDIARMESDLVAATARQDAAQVSAIRGRIEATRARITLLADEASAGAVSRGFGPPARSLAPETIAAARARLAPSLETRAERAVESARAALNAELAGRNRDVVVGRLRNNLAVQEQSLERLRAGIIDDGATGLGPRGGGASPRSPRGISDAEVRARQEVAARLESARGDSGGPTALLRGTNDDATRLVQEGSALRIVEEATPVAVPRGAVRSLDDFLGSASPRPLPVAANDNARTLVAANDNLPVRALSAANDNMPLRAPPLLPQGAANAPPLSVLVAGVLAPRSFDAAFDTPSVLSIRPFDFTAAVLSSPALGTALSPVSDFPLSASIARPLPTLEPAQQPFEAPRISEARLVPVAAPVRPVTPGFVSAAPSRSLGAPAVGPAPRSTAAAPSASRPLALPAGIRAADLTPTPAPTTPARTRAPIPGDIGYIPPTYAPGYPPGTIPLTDDPGGGLRRAYEEEQKRIQDEQRRRFFESRIEWALQRLRTLNPSGAARFAEEYSDLSKLPTSDAVLSQLGSLLMRVQQADQNGGVLSGAGRDDGGSPSSGGPLRRSDDPEAIQARARAAQERALRALQALAAPIPERIRVTAAANPGAPVERLYRERQWAELSRATSDLERLGLAGPAAPLREALGEYERSRILANVTGFTRDPDGTITSLIRSMSPMTPLERSLAARYATRGDAVPGAMINQSPPSMLPPPAYGTPLVVSMGGVNLIEKYAPGYRAVLTGTAACDIAQKCITLALSDSPLTVFHEIGHALTMSDRSLEVLKTLTALQRAYAAEFQAGRITQEQYDRDVVSTMARKIELIEAFERYAWLKTFDLAPRVLTETGLNLLDAWRSVGAQTVALDNSYRTYRRRLAERPESGYGSKIEANYLTAPARETLRRYVEEIFDKGEREIDLAYALASVRIAATPVIPYPNMLFSIVPQTAVPQPSPFDYVPARDRSVYASLQDPSLVTAPDGAADVTAKPAGDRLSTRASAAVRRLIAREALDAGRGVPHSDYTETNLTEALSLLQKEMGTEAYAELQQRIFDSLADWSRNPLFAHIGTDAGRQAAAVVFLTDLYAGLSPGDIAARLGVSDQGLGGQAVRDHALKIRSSGFSYAGVDAFLPTLAASTGAPSTEAIIDEYRRAIADAYARSARAADQGWPAGVASRRVLEELRNDALRAGARVFTEEEKQKVRELFRGSLRGMRVLLSRATALSVVGSRRARVITPNIPRPVAEDRLAQIRAAQDASTLIAATRSAVTAGARANDRARSALRDVQAVRGVTEIESMRATAGRLYDRLAEILQDASLSETARAGYEARLNPVLAILKDIETSTLGATPAPAAGGGRGPGGSIAVFRDTMRAAHNRAVGIEPGSSVTLTDLFGRRGARTSIARRGPGDVIPQATPAEAVPVRSIIGRVDPTDPAQLRVHAFVPESDIPVASAYRRLVSPVFPNIPFIKGEELVVPVEKGKGHGTALTRHLIGVSRETGLPVVIDNSIDAARQGSVVAAMYVRAGYTPVEGTTYMVYDPTGLLTQEQMKQMVTASPYERLGSGARYEWKLEGDGQVVTIVDRQGNPITPETLRRAVIADQERRAPAPSPAPEQPLARSSRFPRIAAFFSGLSRQVNMPGPGLIGEFIVAAARDASSILRGTTANDAFMRKIAEQDQNLGSLTPTERELIEIARNPDAIRTFFRDRAQSALEELQAIVRQEFDGDMYLRELALRYEGRPLSPDEEHDLLQLTRWITNVRDRVNDAFATAGRLGLRDAGRPIATLDPLSVESLASFKTRFENVSARLHSAAQRIEQAARNLPAVQSGNVLIVARPSSGPMVDASQISAALAEAGILVSVDRLSTVVTALNDYQRSYVVVDDFNAADGSLARVAFREYLELMGRDDLVAIMDTNKLRYSNAIGALVSNIETLRDYVIAQQSPQLYAIIERVRQAVPNLNRRAYDALPPYLSGDEGEPSKVGVVRVADRVVNELIDILTRPADAISSAPRVLTEEDKVAMIEHTAKLLYAGFKPDATASERAVADIIWTGSALGGLPDSVLMTPKQHFDAAMRARSGRQLLNSLSPTGALTDPSYLERLVADVRSRSLINAVALNDIAYAIVDRTEAAGRTVTTDMHDAILHSAAAIDAGNRGVTADLAGALERTAAALRRVSDSDRNLVQKVFAEFESNPARFVSRTPRPGGAGVPDPIAAAPVPEELVKELETMAQDADRIVRIVDGEQALGFQDALRAHRASPLPSRASLRKIVLAAPLAFALGTNFPSLLSRNIASEVRAPLTHIIGLVGAPSAHAQVRLSARDRTRLENARRDLGKLQTGIASWYDLAHRDRFNPTDLTASGAYLDDTQFTVALLGSAEKYAWGTKIAVKNLDNGREILVVVTNTGSQRGRHLDLSPAAARALGVTGVANVQYAVVEVPQEHVAGYKKGRTDIISGGGLLKTGEVARLAAAAQQGKFSTQLAARPGTTFSQIKARLSTNPEAAPVRAPATVETTPNVPLSIIDYARGAPRVTEQELRAAESIAAREARASVYDTLSKQPKGTFVTDTGLVQNVPGLNIVYDLRLPGRGPLSNPKAIVWHYPVGQRQRLIGDARKQIGLQVEIGNSYHFYLTDSLDAAGNITVVQGLSLREGAIHIMPPEHRSRTGEFDLTRENTIAFACVGTGTWAPCSPRQIQAGLRLGAALASEYAPKGREVAALRNVGHGELQLKSMTPLTGVADTLRSTLSSLGFDKKKALREGELEAAIARSIQRSAEPSTPIAELGAPPSAPPATRSAIAPPTQRIADRARQALRPVADPRLSLDQPVVPRMTGNYPAGLHPVIRNAMDRASLHLPPGYTVRYTNAARGSSTVGRSLHTQRDPANPAYALAVDIYIVDDQGRDLPNIRSPEHFRVYEQFMQHVKAYQDLLYPELRHKGRWGGYFASGVPQDLMHYDLGPAHMMGAGTWENGLKREYAHYGVDGDVGRGMGRLADYRLPKLPSTDTSPVARAKESEPAAGVKSPQIPKTAEVSAPKPAPASIAKDSAVLERPLVPETSPRTEPVAESPAHPLHEGDSAGTIALVDAIEREYPTAPRNPVFRFSAPQLQSLSTTPSEGRAGPPPKLDHTARPQFAIPHDVLASLSASEGKAQTDLLYARQREQLSLRVLMDHYRVASESEIPTRSPDDAVFAHVYRDMLLQSREAIAQAELQIVKVARDRAALESVRSEGVAVDALQELETQLAQQTRRVAMAREAIIADRANYREAFRAKQPYRNLSELRAAAERVESTLSRRYGSDWMQRDLTSSSLTPFDRLTILNGLETLLLAQDVERGFVRLAEEVLPSRDPTALVRLESPAQLPPLPQPTFADLKGILPRRPLPRTGQAPTELPTSPVVPERQLPRIPREEQRRDISITDARILVRAVIERTPELVRMQLLKRQLTAEETLREVSKLTKDLHELYGITLLLVDDESRIMTLTPIIRDSNGRIKYSRGVNYGSYDDASRTIALRGALVDDPPSLFSELVHELGYARLLEMYGARNALPRVILDEEIGTQINITHFLDSQVSVDAHARFAYMRGSPFPEEQTSPHIGPVETARQAPSARWRDILSELERRVDADKMRALSEAAIFAELDTARTLALADELRSPYREELERAAATMGSAAFLYKLAHAQFASGLKRASAETEGSAVLARQEALARAARLRDDLMVQSAPVGYFPDWIGELARALGEPEWAQRLSRALRAPEADFRTMSGQLPEDIPAFLRRAAAERMSNIDSLETALAPDRVPTRVDATETRSSAGVDSSPPKLRPQRRIRDILYRVLVGTELDKLRALEFAAQIRVARAEALAERLAPGEGARFREALEHMHESARHFSQAVTAMERLGWTASMEAEIQGRNAYRRAQNIISEIEAALTGVPKLTYELSNPSAPRLITRRLSDALIAAELISPTQIDELAGIAQQVAQHMSKLDARIAEVLRDDPSGVSSQQDQFARDRYKEAYLAIVLASQQIERGLLMRGVHAQQETEARFWLKIAIAAIARSEDPTDFIGGGSGGNGGGGSGGNGGGGRGGEPPFVPPPTGYRASGDGSGGSLRLWVQRFWIALFALLSSDTEREKDDALRDDPPSVPAATPDTGPAPRQQLDIAAPPRIPDEQTTSEDRSGRPADTPTQQFSEAETLWEKIKANPNIVDDEGEMGAWVPVYGHEERIVGLTPRDPEDAARQPWFPPGTDSSMTEPTRHPAAPANHDVSDTRNPVLPRASAPQTHTLMSGLTSEKRMPHTPDASGQGVLGRDGGGSVWTGAAGAGGGNAGAPVDTGSESTGSFPGLGNIFSLLNQLLRLAGLVSPPAGQQNQSLPQPILVSISLKPDKLVAQKGERVAMRWKATGVQSCTVYAQTGPLATGGPEGVVQTPALERTSIFRLVCIKTQGGPIEIFTTIRVPGTPNPTRADIQTVAGLGQEQWQGDWQSAIRHPVYDTCNPQDPRMNLRTYLACQGLPYDPRWDAR